MAPARSRKTLIVAAAVMLAGALVVAGRARDLVEGAALAAEAVDSGRAAATLERLVRITGRRE